MNLDRLSIKLYLEEPGLGDIREIIPIFHSWIQKQSISDHLLLDVHDYSHVPEGPGIFLYGHEGSFSLDLGQNRIGLLYQRNKNPNGDADNRLAESLRTLLQGCLLLESEKIAGAFPRFKTSEFRLAVHSRLHAPNTEETFQRFQPVLAKFLGQTLEGNKFRIDHMSDPTELFAIEVSGASPLPVEELYARLENDTIN
jgi:hypothetical protein